MAEVKVGRAASWEGGVENDDTIVQRGVLVVEREGSVSQQALVGTGFESAI